MKLRLRGKPFILRYVFNIATHIFKPLCTFFEIKTTHVELLYSKNTQIKVEAAEKNLLKKHTLPKKPF